MAAAAWMPTVGTGTGRTLLRGARDAPGAWWRLRRCRPAARSRCRRALAALRGGMAAGLGPNGGSAALAGSLLPPPPSPGRRREGAAGAVIRAGQAGGAQHHPSERPAERSRRRGHSSGGTTAAAGSSRCAPGSRHSLERHCRRARGTGHCGAAAGLWLATFWPPHLSSGIYSSEPLWNAGLVPGLSRKYGFLPWVNEIYFVPLNNSLLEAKSLGPPHLTLSAKVGKNSQELIMTRDFKVRMDQFSLGGFFVGVTNVELQYNVPGPWFLTRQTVPFPGLLWNVNPDSMCRSCTITPCTVNLTFSFDCSAFILNHRACFGKLCLPVAVTLYISCGATSKNRSSLDYFSPSVHYNTIIILFYNILIYYHYNMRIVLVVVVSVGANIICSFCYTPSCQ